MMRAGRPLILAKIVSYKTSFHSVICQITDKCSNVHTFSRFFHTRFLDLGGRRIPFQPCNLEDSVC